MKSVLRVILAAGVGVAMMVGTSASAETLEVAANIGNVPWQYQDESGKLAGFEIDLVNEIAKRLGYEPSYTSIPFNGLFAAVKSGRAQLAISSITIKPSRMENVDFAQPYYDSDQALAVNAKSGVKGLKDLNGKAIAVETGSTGDSWATENQKKYGFSEIRRYEGMTNAFLDVSAGRVDGYIFDIPNVQFYIKDKPQYAVVERIVTNEQFSMIFQKGDGLRAKVNDIITALKNEGVIANIHEKYFGIKPEPSTSTVEVLPMPSL